METVKYIASLALNALKDAELRAADLVEAHPHAALAVWAGSLAFAWWLG